MHMDDLLRALMERKGSDLHMMAGMPPAVRKNGELTPLDTFERLTPEIIKQAVYDILSEEQRQKFESDPTGRFELDFAYSINGLGRFRFNVHKQRGTLGVVARSLASSIPTLEKLNLPESVIRMTQARKGLALVTGPTGSGKSTTLAAIINHINETRADHILTIEDPVEYLHNSKKSYVTQREVGDAADTLSFKNALRGALRQDPDVILIGEMRDFETIGIAITSAETGHLVFGTLHTNSAAQTIGRIIDVFPSDQVEQVKTQLGATLFGVLAQILLPRADGTGRVCACEIMFSNPAIRNNIRSNNIDAIYQAIQTGSKEGMQTMDQSIVAHVKKGVLDYDTARPFLRDEFSHRQLAGCGSPGANGESGTSPGNPAATNSGTGTGSKTPAPTTPPQPQREPSATGRMGAVIPPWEKK